MLFINTTTEKNRFANTFPNIPNIYFFCNCEWFIKIMITFYSAWTLLTPLVTLLKLQYKYDKKIHDCTFS